MIKYIITLALFSCALFGCDEGFNFKGAVTGNQIYFQYEYMNHAWGFQQHGWLIDSAGNVYCYNLPENWYEPDSNGVIEADALKANILKTDSICYSVNSTDLDIKIQLIEAAADGVLKEPVSVMADAGAFSYYAFLYDANAEKYQRILLWQTGDNLIENTSVEAKELFEWLDEINQAIH